jgi:hypothetical protein
MAGGTELLGAAGGATPWGAIAGVGLGLIGGIGKMFGRAKANRELKALAKQDPTYSADPRIMQMANQRLGLANTLLNARSPGAMQAERNIYSTQAGQLAGLNRSATDASQALAVAAGIGGQTQDAFTNLGQQEAQDYYRRLENQGQAQQGVMNEAQRVEGNMFNDQLRKYQNKMDIHGAMQQNRQNTWGDISNLGFGLADFGMSGGFNGMFGQTNESVINGLQSNSITNGRVLNTPIQRTGTPRIGIGSGGGFNVQNPQMRTISPYPYNRPQYNFNYNG